MNKCNKTINAMKYSDDECHNISLTKLKDRVKSELKCKYCSKVYSTLYVLDNHIKKYCKKYNDDIDKHNIDNHNIDNHNIDKNNIDKHNIDNHNIDNHNIDNHNIDNHNIDKNNIDKHNIDKNNIDKHNIDKNENETNIKNETNKIINNITNISNISNNNIYIIQNINVNVPIPFDKDWNTEHIDNNIKQLILLAENKYTNLLQKILENKNNLNVVMEKNANIGYIYNSKNEYKDMDKNDIIDISMEKLYNELNKIKDESNNFDIKVSEEFINNSVSKIENKYNDYKNDHVTKVKVQNCLSNIFDNTKNDALEIYNNINDNNINEF
jgi:hypothetical protein